MTSGHYHNCARDSDDRPRCWGRARMPFDYGQSDPPQGTFVRLASGARFTCGLRGDGVLECWGAIHPDEN